MRRLARDHLVLLAAGGGEPRRRRRRRRHAHVQGRALQRLRPGQGSEVRVAGVKAGTITDLDINAQKTALVTIEVSGPSFPESRPTRAARSEPQSLIAEYFLDCQPGTRDAAASTTGPDPGGTATRRTTVQNDLVQNTLREPFKRAAAASDQRVRHRARRQPREPERGDPGRRPRAPAAQAGPRHPRPTRTGRSPSSTSNSDAIVAQLGDRREDVVRFIDNAGAAAATRRSAATTSRAELRPARRLPRRAAADDVPARQRRRRADAAADRPARRRARAQQAGREPAAVQRRRPSSRSTSLGGAAQRRQGRAGKRARTRSRALDQTSTKAYPGRRTRSRSSSRPRRPAAARSRRTPCALRPARAAGRGGQAGPGPRPEDGRHAARRPDGPVQVGQRAAAGPERERRQPGYTGMEGLLNYVYYQAGALNLVRLELGHAAPLHARRAPRPAPCGDYNAGPTVPLRRAAARPHRRRTEELAACAGILGDSQPGINDGTNPRACSATSALRPERLPRRARTERSATATRPIAATNQRRARAPRRRRRSGRPRAAAGRTPAAASQPLPKIPGLPGLPETACRDPGQPQLDRTYSSMTPRVSAVQQRQAAAPAALDPTSDGRSAAPSATDDLLDFLLGPMNGADASVLAASPTMVGAITTLIVIVAVFLAYNANNGLPFVPVYRVSVELCQRRAARRPTTRSGSAATGSAWSSRSRPIDADQRAAARPRTAQGPSREARPEARQDAPSRCPPTRRSGSATSPRSASSTWR